MYALSKWEDHVNHLEKLIVISYAILAVATFSYLFIRNPLDLFIVQAFMGVGGAILSPAYGAMYSKSLDKGRFASEWGLWDSMTNMILAVAAITGGVITAFLGFAALFIIMGLIASCGFVASAFLFRKKKSSRNRVRKK